MEVIKFSAILSAIKNKNNSYLNINETYTNDIKIEFDDTSDDIENTLAFIIAGIIANDYKILNLINFGKLTQKSILEINRIKLFLESSDYGKIVDLSERKDLIQFEIITRDTSYQIEVHFGNFNYCVCKNFDIIAVDGLK